MVPCPGRLQELLASSIYQELVESKLRRTVKCGITEFRRKILDSLLFDKKDIIAAIMHSKRQSLTYRWSKYLNPYEVQHSNSMFG